MGAGNTTIFGYHVDPKNYAQEGLSKESQELTAFCLLAPAIDVVASTLTSGFLAMAGLTGCLTTAILGGSSLRKNARRFARMAEQAAEMMRGTLSEIAGKLTDTSSDGGVKNVAVFANNKDLDAFVKAKIERDKASALAASGIQEKQETT